MKFLNTQMYSIIMKLNFYFYIPLLFFAMIQMADFEWGITSISRLGIIFSILALMYCFYLVYYLWDVTDDSKS